VIPSFHESAVAEEVLKPHPQSQLVLRLRQRARVRLVLGVDIVQEQNVQMTTNATVILLAAEDTATAVLGPVIADVHHAHQIMIALMHLFARVESAPFSL